MNKPSQEDLLGYVLGAMDAQEARNIQAHIDQRPELDDELLDIKNSLLPLDNLDSGGTRPGLARRTCEWVAASQKDQREAHLASALEAAEHSADGPAMSDGPGSDPLAAAPLAHNEVATARKQTTAAKMAPAAPLPSSSWFSNISLPNVLVTAAGLAIIGGILFPAISYTRHHSRLAACQNNLQKLGHAFLKYSDLNQGQFVAIPNAGKLSASGCFGPILKDSGLIEDDSLLACAGVADDQPVHIPTIEQLQAANGPTLVRLQQRMGGHFGYSMGYRDQGRYHSPENAGRTNVVLLADAPSSELIGRRSRNHGRQGQNGLFEDGHVQFISGHSIGGDAIYENDYGIVAPGSHARDSVIAPSHLSPQRAPIEFISLP